MRRRGGAGRVIGRVGAVLVLALAAGLLVAAGTPGPAHRLEEDLAALPSEGAFYEQPDPLPPGAPGDLIRSARAAGTPLGATAHRILFHSTDLRGRPVVNSGVVVAPAAPAPPGGRTIVSWGHPTTGTAERCAPSRFVDPYFFVEGLADLIRRGYIVVYTDYTGMGTAGPDSYLVGGTEGRNVLDAARAARRLLGDQASDRLVLWGHSQGGQAVLFAAQLAASYAPELRLEAVAVAAPATDLGALMRADIGDIAGVSIASYAFTAFSQVYGVPLDTILTPAAEAALPGIARLCLLTQNAEVHRIARPLIGSFLASDPQTTEPWASLLAENTPGGVRLGVPLFVAQGEADRLVRPAATDAFVEGERALASDVTYDRIPGATHATVAVKALPRLFAWLDGTGATATR